MIVKDQWYDIGDKKEREILQEFKKLFPIKNWKILMPFLKVIFETSSGIVGDVQSIWFLVPC